MNEKNARTELFENCPIPVAVAKLALPSVIGQIILVMYNIADTFFLGLTGSDVLITAATVCMPMFMALSAISNLFGVGGASAIARAMGLGRRDRAQRAAAFAFWGCAALTLVYSLVIFLFADGLIDLLGGKAPAVHASAKLYLTWTVLLGGMATVLSGLLSHLVRAEGRSVQASFGVALGGILNIVLDPLLMFVVLPEGNEMLGASLATFTSNVVSAGYFAILLVRNRRTSVLTLGFSRAVLADGLPKEILSTGLPACLMTLFENLSFAVLDGLMALGGTAVQAGLGVAKKVNMLAHCLARGMAQGVLPLISYNYAAKRYDRMRATILISMTSSVALAALCTATCLSFGPRLVGLFLADGAESALWGAQFLRILCLGGPFSACAYAFISFFQAVGEGKKSLLLALLRKGLLDIPLMFVLQWILPLSGAVWATPAADCVCCAMSIQMFILFAQQLPKERTTLCPAVQ